VTSSPESFSSVKSGAGSPSASIAPSLRRAIGIVRVSRVAGEHPVSPSEQRQRIEAACGREGFDLLDTLEELDVSGGTPLAARPKLLSAVTAVEAGEADVIVVAFFDRLVRSLAVQRELLERVEAANGAILAVDVGEVRADTASRWLSSTMLGMVAEYHRLGHVLNDQHRRLIGFVANREQRAASCVPAGSRHRTSSWERRPRASADRPASRLRTRARK